MKRNLLWAFSFAFLVQAACTAAGANLIQNGGFETIDQKNLPQGWMVQQKEKVQFLKEGGKHWVKFKDGGRLKCMIDVKPGWKWVRVAARRG